MTQQTHSFEDGCRCGECVWATLLAYRPLIERISWQVYRANPFMVRDREDLAGFLTERAFRILEGYRAGPQGSSPSGYLKTYLPKRALLYVTRANSDRHAANITQHTINSNGALQVGDSEQHLDAFDEDVYQRIEDRDEGRALLRWAEEVYVESGGARTAAAKAIRRHALNRLMRWVRGESMADIAASEEVSHQAIRQSITKVMSYIRDNFRRVEA